MTKIRTHTKLYYYNSRIWVVEHCIYEKPTERHVQNEYIGEKCDRILDSPQNLILRCLHIII